jgi:uncharacterized membrane protein
MGDARAVMAKTSGYVQAIDFDALMRIAREHDIVVRVHDRPGAFVRREGVLLTVTSAPGRTSPDDTTFDAVFIIGDDRNGTQDVTFFIEQLVDLAVRALSPGINDPGTARLCIDRLERALCHLGGRHFRAAERYDQGRLRVLACPLTFPDVVSIAFDEIARYGRSSVSVTCRLLVAIQSVGSCVTREVDRSALLRQATALAEGVRDLALRDGDREVIARCHRAALDALTRRSDLPTE